jgi:hypothetical protein
MAMQGYYLPLLGGVQELFRGVASAAAAQGQSHASGASSPGTAPATNGHDHDEDARSAEYGEDEGDEELNVDVEEGLAAVANAAAALEQLDQALSGEAFASALAGFQSQIQAAAAGDAPASVQGQGQQQLQGVNGINVQQLQLQMQAMHNFMSTPGGVNAMAVAAVREMQSLTLQDRSSSAAATASSGPASTGPVPVPVHVPMPIPPLSAYEEPTETGPDPEDREPRDYGDDDGENIRRRQDNHIDSHGTNRKKRKVPTNTQHERGDGDADGGGGGGRRSPANAHAATTAYGHAFGGALPHHPHAHPHDEEEETDGASEHEESGVEGGRGGVAGGVPTGGGGVFDGPGPPEGESPTESHAPPAVARESDRDEEGRERDGKRNKKTKKGGAQSDAGAEGGEGTKLGGGGGGGGGGGSGGLDRFKGRMSRITLAGIAFKETMKSRKRQMANIIDSLAESTPPIPGVGSGPGGGGGGGVDDLVEMALSANWPFAKAKWVVDQAVGGVPPSSSSSTSTPRSKLSKTDKGGFSVSLAREEGGGSKGHGGGPKVRVSHRKGARLGRIARKGLRMRHPDMAPLEEVEFAFRVQSESEFLSTGALFRNRDRRPTKCFHSYYFSFSFFLRLINNFMVLTSSFNSVSSPALDKTASPVSPATFRGRTISTGSESGQARSGGLQGT